MRTPTDNPLDPLGHVVSLSGSSANIRLAPDAATSGEARITIGSFLGIETGTTSVVSVVTHVDGTDGASASSGLVVKADLMGEIRPRENGTIVFQRGITRYPVIGDGVRILTGDNLRKVFDTSGAAVIKIGKLQQDNSIEATIKVDVAVIEVNFEQRESGRSAYTTGRLVRHALNMITGYSTRPLKWVSVFGFVCAAFGFALLAFVVVRYFLDQSDVPGFSFLAAAITFFSGVQLLSLGVIGEYVGRMHFRSMGRPPYVVRERTDRPEETT